MIKNQEGFGNGKILKITALVAMIILIIYFSFIFYKSPGTDPFDGVHISVIPENRNITK